MAQLNSIKINSIKFGAYLNTIYNMQTQVIMKRALFGCEISQQSKSEYFSASDLVNAGDKWRLAKGMKEFQFYQYLKNKSTKEFISALELKYKTKALVSSKGRNGQTWVHPLLFIDIALAISPELKIEVYEWLFDHLMRFRNDSGDSYKQMCTALFGLNTNQREFPKFISEVADQIKIACNVTDWQTATQEQLNTRDKIHNAIKLLCNVLKDDRQAVRIGISEIIKI